MSRLPRHLPGIAAIVIWIAPGLFLPRLCNAQRAPSIQKTFASPEDAVTALLAAVKIRDKAALQEMFGAEVPERLIDDGAKDIANSQRFADALEERAITLSEGRDRVILLIGANKWPFPTPLVKMGASWRFDTAAGKEESAARRIGKNELYAIGVLTSFVQAQRLYAGLPRDASEMVQYARRLMSSPGKKDGLYWKTSPNEVQSPFGALIADADAGGGNPEPFHGYLFKVLTKQGVAAPRGRMDYIKAGRLTGGFAMVAYPKEWGRSGIMTLIVNQDARIHQRDLGEKTSRIAAAMTEYDPDDGWTPVNDPGIIEGN